MPDKPSYEYSVARMHDRKQEEVDYWLKLEKAALDRKNSFWGDSNLAERDKQVYSKYRTRAEKELYKSKKFDNKPDFSGTVKALTGAGHEAVKELARKSGKKK